MEHARDEWLHLIATDFDEGNPMEDFKQCAAKDVLQAFFVEGRLTRPKTVEENRNHVGKDAQCIHILVPVNAVAQLGGIGESGLEI